MREEEEFESGEIDYQDNPGLANWGLMEKNREQFDGDVLPDVKFKGVRVTKKLDKKTGKEAYSFSGGPCVSVVGKDGGDFLWRTTEGVMKPFRKASLFTFTSKMSCASFSLPAGPTKHGTCPASKPASIEAEGSYTDFSPPLSETPSGEKFICDLCYAGKNNYLRHTTVSIGQMAKLQWVKNAIRNRTFARQMIEAIGMLLDQRIESVLKAHLVSNRFFRIHDSGDFYEPEYYKAWVEICKAFQGKMPGSTGAGPLIYFWAPSRMWVYEKWRELFQSTPPPVNLALRPSALFTSAPPPSIQGLAEGSASVADEMPAPVWNCPAYTTDEGSCAGAKCRVCWTRKKVGVNYMTH